MNPEHDLEQLHPAEPPDTLDQRMERLFTDAEYRAYRWYQNPVALWQCAALCAVAFGLGVFFSGETEPPKAPAQERVTTIYYIDGDPEALRNALTADQGGVFGGKTPPSVRVYPAVDGGQRGADNI